MFYSLQFTFWINFDIKETFLLVSDSSEPLCWLGPALLSRTRTLASSEQLSIAQAAIDILQTMDFLSRLTEAYWKPTWKLGTFFCIILANCTSELKGAVDCKVLLIKTSHCIKRVNNTWKTAKSNVSQAEHSVLFYRKPLRDNMMETRIFYWNMTSVICLYSNPGSTSNSICKQSQYCNRKLIVQYGHLNLMNVGKRKQGECLSSSVAK